MAERRAGDRRRDGRDRLLTDNQAAQIAGVSVNTVKYWRQNGVLPFVKVGRHPRIWFSKLMKLFGKPGADQTLENVKSSAKIRAAWDIRRKS